MKISLDTARFQGLKSRLRWGTLAFIIALALVLAGTLGSFAPALGLICLVVSLWSLRELRTMSLFSSIPINLWLCIELAAVFHFLRVGAGPFLPADFAVMIFLTLFVSSVVAMRFACSISHLSALWMSYFYIILPLYCLCLIAQGNGVLSLSDRRWWLAIALLIPKIYDISAYFTGQRWGKHRITPYLSPKKTIEGCIGGFLAVVAVMSLFTFFTKIATLTQMLLGAVVVSILAQFGDLFESWIKRQSQIKDSGAIPGLGGVLDMIDALLWTAPVFLWLMSGGKI